MRLARVKLDFPFRVPGSAMEEAQIEISEDDTSTAPGKPGAMHYDAATHSLVFDQAGVGINWAHVVHWEKLDMELECEVCGSEFRSANALGGHRRHCKVGKEKPLPRPTLEELEAEDKADRERWPGENL